MNLLLEIARLDDLDIQYVNWWLKYNRGYWLRCNYDYSRAEIAFMDKNRLRKRADEYLRRYPGSFSQPTYKKLFLEKGKRRR